MDVKNDLPLSEPSLLHEQCYVNGEWTAASGRRTIDVTNPATGARIGCVPAFTRDDTRRTIEAASAAWPGWRARPAKERAVTLHGHRIALAGGHRQVKLRSLITMFSASSARFLVLVSLPASTRFSYLLL